MAASSVDVRADLWCGRIHPDSTSFDKFWIHGDRRHQSVVNRMSDHTTPDATRSPHDDAEEQAEPQRWQQAIDARVGDAEQKGTLPARLGAGSPITPTYRMNNIS